MFRTFAIAFLFWLVGCNGAAAQQSSPQTYSERLAKSDVVVVATAVDSAEPLSAAEDRHGLIRFQIERVIKGGSMVRIGERFEARCSVAPTENAKFLVSANLAEDQSTAKQWNRANLITDACIQHLLSFPAQQQSAATRLAFFWEALEHEDALISTNAHLEFALADDEILDQLEPQLDRTLLVRWLQEPELPLGRQRLYFALLGICGTEEDADWIEGRLRSQKLELSDAAIVCYLKLRGAEGLPLVNQLCFDDREVEYIHAVAAIQAFRHLAAKQDSTISHPQIAASLRLMLKRPELADLVIGDLANLKDWTSLTRIAELFDQAGPQTEWVRVPAVNFLRVCPLEEAKQHLQRFQEMDPRAVQRATYFLPAEELGRPASRPSIRPRGRIGIPFC